MQNGTTNIHFIYSFVFIPGSSAGDAIQYNDCLPKRHHQLSLVTIVYDMINISPFTCTFHHNIFHTLSRFAIYIYIYYPKRSRAISHINTLCRAQTFRGKYLLTRLAVCGSIYDVYST